MEEEVLSVDESCIFNNIVEFVRLEEHTCHPCAYNGFDSCVCILVNEYTGHDCASEKGVFVMKDIY